MRQLFKLSVYDKRKIGAPIYAQKNMGKREETMETIKLRDEYIKLGQALKAAGMVGSGVDAKFVIEDGLVQVNGQVEYQRGKKLRAGDVVTFDGNTVKIEE